MEAAGPGPNLGLGDESWVFQTSIYLANSTRRVDSIRQGDACMRISIGEFMRSRSEALGSLDGDPHIDRVCRRCGQEMKNNGDLLLIHSSFFPFFVELAFSNLNSQVSQCSCAYSAKTGSAWLSCVV